MMENGFLYVCVYIYLFIFSYPKLCFSYSGKEAVGSLFGVFSPPDFRAVKMGGTRGSCLLSCD